MVLIAPLDLVGRAREAAAVQAEALGPPPSMAADRAAVFLRHATHPCFRAFGAFDGSRLVGFSYGSLCVDGQWWFDQIRPALTAAGRAAWAVDAYAVTELHVLPAHQGSGLGIELLTRLLRGVDRPTALLSTYEGESRARRLYRGLGFSDLLSGMRFGVHEQRYAIMGALLPLAEAGRTVLPGQAGHPGGADVTPERA